MENKTIKELVDDYISLKKQGRVELKNGNEDLYIDIQDKCFKMGNEILDIMKNKYMKLRKGRFLYLKEATFNWYWGVFNLKEGIYLKDNPSEFVGNKNKGTIDIRALQGAEVISKEEFIEAAKTFPQKS